MEEELRTSEEGFRLLVEGAADHAIFMLDPSGRVITWNPGAERIKSWRADDILGRHFSVFYAPEDVASGQPERDLERAAAEGRAQSDGWRVRANGQRFWAETTLSAVRDETGTLRGFAKVTRDRTEAHQARARLESIGELNRAVLERFPEEELLALVASRARAMVNATLVAAWASTTDDGGLVVTYADGDGTSAVRETRAGEDSVVSSVSRSTRAELVPDFKHDLRVARELVDAGLGSGLFIPLHAAGETFGVIGVMMAREREAVQPHEADMLQAFGIQAGASFAHARARREVEQLRVVSERERIARDLHDTVIQRLFAVGMALEATSRRPPAETQDRLHRAVADIDDTIRSIRTSIFSLETRAEEESGLRGHVLDVIAHATPVLSFEPSVQFDGPVDTRRDRDCHRPSRRDATRSPRERGASRARDASDGAHRGPRRHRPDRRRQRRRLRDLPTRWRSRDLELARTSARVGRRCLDQHAIASRHASRVARCLSSASPARTGQRPDVIPAR